MSLSWILFKKNINVKEKEMKRSFMNRIENENEKSCLG